MGQEATSRPEPSSKTPSDNEWNDTRVEIIMGNLLRAGVIIAAAVVLLGGVAYLLQSGSSEPAYHVFEGEPADLRGLRGIATDAFSFQARGVIQLGLLLLIATPIARVCFSVYAFARERDGFYVAVTLIVLAALLYGLTET